MKEIMDTSLVEGYIFFFEVLDMVGKECQHAKQFPQKQENCICSRQRALAL